MSWLTSTAFIHKDFVSPSLTTGGPPESSASGESAWPKKRLSLNIGGSSPTATFIVINCAAL